MISLPRRLAPACSAALFGLAAIAVTATVVAQSYPVKPVRVLVGFPPGAGVDITTRLFMPELAKAFGQQFVVDNRPGAAGNIAAEIAAKTPPDGYSLLSASAPIVMSQALYSKPNFNLERDFDPIGMMASAPFILVVHPSLPAKSVKELVALATVPTWKEQRADIVVANWRPVIGPRGLSAAQVAFWEDALASVTRSAEWKNEVAHSGSVNHYMNSRDLAAYFDAQYAQFRAVLTELGLAKLP